MRSTITRGGFISVALTLLFVATLISKIQSQCPTTIPLHNQQRLIDSMALYPNCEHYPKGLSITGNNLTDLSPLSSLKSVQYLSIARDSSLSSLYGLHNITTVSGYFSLRESPLITTADGLASLTTVGGNFAIEKMSSLQNLDGFSRLQSVGGDMDINNFPEIDNIDGFDNLEEIGGEFLVHVLDAVQTVSGFNALTSVGGRLLISTNNNLKKIDGFNGLISIERALSVGSNPVLDSITGFQSLTTVNSDVSIHFEQGGVLHLDALETVAGFAYFSDITTLSLENLRIVGLNLSFPQYVENLSGLDKLERVEGTFNIVRTSAEQLPAFESLDHVGGSLYITDNANLRTINGFNALETIDGKLWIYGSQPNLTEIKGFNNLKTVGENFNIRDNEFLRTICGFESLEYVGEDLDIWFNDSLNQCDILCPILESGGVAGDIHILANWGPCAWESTLRDFCDQPFQRMTILDGNPDLLSSFLFPIDDVRNVDAEDIITATLLRDAVTADGVTEVVLIAEFKEEGEFSFEVDGETLEMPWNSETIEVEGRYYGLAMYKAPDIFPEDLQLARMPGTPSMALQDIEVIHTNDENDTKEATDQITLVRPPVVLVHGTFSSPAAWTDKTEPLSMSEALEEAGFDVFLVDYEASNGSGSFLYSSTFSANSEVVWENNGGIEDALAYYRDTKKAAVTQADVIGHSMGGILGRVYASENYNDEYERKDNFMEGDINRLITLASTHFGSHLGEMQLYLENATVFDVGLLGWMLNGAATTAAWLNGTTPSEAVVDQLPPPPSTETALALIGRTEIPVHAITCSVPKGQLKDPVHDPNQEYYNLYSYMSLLFYYNATMTENYLDKKLELCDLPGVKSNRTKAGVMPSALYPDLTEEEIFKGMFIDAIDAEGKILEVLDGEWEMPSDIEIFKYITAETGMSDWDPMIDIFVAGANPTDVALDLFWDYATPTPPEVPERPDDLTEAVRFMIFNNDDNDGTVRVESQSGELEKECENCVTALDNVLHGPAPQYEAVQNRIIDLLTGGMDDFHPEGFPAVDHVQTLYYPPTNIAPPPVTKDANAICQSGMVKTHARAFADVANQRNTVIIVRPVNPDATILIERGAATKEMDVKPKSSNWGPQKGYLPVNQRYSKLSEIYSGVNRDNKINEYNQKSQENLDAGLTVKRQLIVSACNQNYFVRVDSAFIIGSPLESVKDEVVLVHVNDPSMVCTWGDSFDENTPINVEMDCQEITDLNRIGPFEVMATPRELEHDGVTKRFLTADYDLLMIGFYKGDDNPYSPPGNIPFKDGVGQITAEQEALVQALNSRVRTRGYKGGNVSHHGPENQFSKSPYIDYPLTVFLPESVAEGNPIRTIRMGKVGFRDSELKMLVNELRKKGYDLYDNTEAPGWKWTWSENLDGFELEDSPLLNDYVEELPIRTCDSKTGSSEIATATCQPPPNKEGVITPGPAEGNSNRSVIDINLWPNPNYTSNITLTVQTSEEVDLNWKIIDAIGTVRLAGKNILTKGEFVEQINTSALEPGMYHFVTSNGTAKTFVRM